MDYSPINFRDKLANVQEQWSPRVIAKLNDYQFKVVKLEGDSIWHTHLETDEAFIILSGELDIEFRNGNVHVREGELFVVPKGGEHKPFASTECAVLLIEPRGTRNTGDAAGERTAELDVCVQLK
jgi:mannose-6-phosphate isomerase-like protein (cupin superfamily)